MELVIEALLKQLLNIAAGMIISGLVAYVKLQNEKIRLRAEAEKKQDEKIELLMEMAHAQAQERILYLSAHYQRQKWVSIDDLRTFMNLVDKYEKLGANGVINSAVVKVQSLPNIPPEE